MGIMRFTVDHSFFVKIKSKWSFGGSARLLAVTSNHFSGLFGTHRSRCVSLKPKNGLATCLAIISCPDGLFGLKIEVAVGDAQVDEVGRVILHSVCTGETGDG